MNAFLFQIRSKLFSGTHQTHLDRTLSHAVLRRNLLDAAHIPVAAHKDLPGLFRQSAEEPVNGCRQLLIIYFLFHIAGSRDAAGQLIQGRCGFSRSTLLCTRFFIKIQREIPGDFTQKRGKPYRSCRYSIFQAIFRQYFPYFREVSAIACSDRLKYRSMISRSSIQFPPHNYRQQNVPFGHTFMQRKVHERPFL